MRRRWQLVLVLGALAALLSPNFILSDECGRIEAAWEHGGDTVVALLKLEQGDDSVFVRRIEADNMRNGFLDFDLVLGLRIFPDKWTPEGKQKAEDWLRNALTLPEEQTAYRFQHRNDNWPFGSQMMRILGGELLDLPEYVEEGIAELERWLPTQGDLDPLNGELGLTSEYISPSYNALSLYCVEAIAAYAHSQRARDLAERILQILWRDWTTRYHWPTQTMVPPQSRSYLAGMTGRDVPMHEWTGDIFGCPATLKDETGYGARLRRIAEAEYVPRTMPLAMRDIALTRTLPVVTRQRVLLRDVNNSKGVWVRQFGVATTYLGPDAALGSATRGYGEGDQGWPVGGVWGKPANVRTWFTRYQTSLENWPNLKADEDVTDQGTYASEQEGKRLLFVSSPLATAGPGWTVLYIQAPESYIKTNGNHVVYEEQGVRWDFTAFGGELVVGRVPDLWMLAVKAERYSGFAVELNGDGRANVVDAVDGDDVTVQWEDLGFTYNLSNHEVSGYEAMEAAHPFDDPDLVFP